MAAWWSLTSTFLLKFLLIATVIDVYFVYPISLAQDGSSIPLSSTQFASPIGQLQSLSDRKSPNDVVFGYIYTVPSSNPKDKHQYYRTTPTPHPQTEPSSPQTANTDHSVQADTLVAGSSTAATPIKGEAGYPRFDDSVTLAAVQRLEALMKTSSYHCYFPGPNYYNVYVPHNYSQGKSILPGEQLNTLNFVYLPNTVEAENIAIENHIASFLGKKPPSSIKKANKIENTRTYLSSFIIVAQLAAERYALLVPTTSSDYLSIRIEADSHDMPAAAWETWKKIKNKASKGMPKRFIFPSTIGRSKHKI
ncbi:hypothetical protein GGU10DRAFT_409285 [Lentinula aff. detonsa]|uniref:Uncharacterized protein n=1 Tax=Lentinula aff. detonsa TaxID=2804958 RepID=A0AA38L2J7_9AGAR|nr:hypothetical protein GGU10DRAFT_409285 [Lentinula aff. detonsa]